MKEQDKLPGYSVDDKGYYTYSEEGEKFRPITFDDCGHLVVMKPSIYHLRMKWTEPMRVNHSKYGFTHRGDNG